LTADLELAGLVGQLAIFDRSVGPRVPALPHYDHDDLGGCFLPLTQYLHGFLDATIEPGFKSRPFFGAERGMQVHLDPSWLQPNCLMFVGVKSLLPPEECVQLLTRPGQLDLKIGSSERVDEIFRLGRRGLSFVPAPTPPRVLPPLPGLTYFQISRETQQEEWHHVMKSRTLAVRLKESQIQENHPGQVVLKVRTAAGQTTPLGFTLYLVS
jgi:type VI secretion system protein ImpJ